MSNKISKEVFDRATSKNDLRPALMKVHGQGKYVYATEGHIMIRAKKTDCDFETKKINNYPGEVFSIIESAKGRSDIEHTLSVGRINDVLSTIPLVDKYDETECSLCFGYGHTECECCGQEEPCDQCGGSGYVKEEEPYDKGFDNDYFINLHDVSLKPDLLKELVELITVAGIDKITFCVPNLNRSELIKKDPIAYNPLYFKASKLDGIIMPMLVPAFGHMKPIPLK